jgi:histidinol dehydrogenase
VKVLRNPLGFSQPQFDLSRVAEIIEEVRIRGDEAVVAFTERFDHSAPRSRT